MIEHTLPKGFQSAGIYCGIKQSKKKDLGVILSELPCNYAGVFTSNSVKAHCVLDNQTILNSQDKNNIRAIVANSGNANACTGQMGKQSLEIIKDNFANYFTLNKDSILTASTGIIGIPLPTEPILKSLPFIKSSLNHQYLNFANAILTTDLDIKATERHIGKSKIVGITKGSGMINPQMATTLTFILTDLRIDSALLQQLLNEANSKSFNQITVDGDTSTNDMILFLSNGATGKEVGKDISCEEFQAKLTDICVELAKKIIVDGEGATKLIEISVKGTNSKEEAQIMAKGIANSLLVKTAIFGNDPNWGRLLAAAGQYGQVDLEHSCVKILDTQLLNCGEVCIFEKLTLQEEMRRTNEIKIELIVGKQLENGGKSWGCDLSYEYVRINAEYST